MRSGRTGSSRFGAPKRTWTLTRTLPNPTFGLQDPSGGILNKSKQILPLVSSTFGWATGVINLTIGGSNGYLKGSQLNCVHTFYRSVIFISNLRVSLAKGVPSGPETSKERVSIEASSSKLSIKTTHGSLSCRFSSEISLSSLVLLTDIDPVACVYAGVLLLQIKF